MITTELFYAPLLTDDHGTRATRFAINKGLHLTGDDRQKPKALIRSHLVSIVIIHAKQIVPGGHSGLLPV